MEEGKVDWTITEKIHRLRQAHGQKIVANPSSSQGKKWGMYMGFLVGTFRMVSVLTKLTIPL